MDRKFTSYIISDYLKIKNQVLDFSKKFDTFCFLDNHEYDFKKSYDCVAGAGIANYFFSNNNSLEKLDDFQGGNKDWIFGHICYDLKNEIEDLVSSHPDRIQFPNVLFFVPEIVFIFSKDVLQIGVSTTESADLIFKEIISSINTKEEETTQSILKSKISQDEYIEIIKKLQAHIIKGDCYEINFCQEFYADESIIEPVEVQKKLNQYSPSPFSAFYKCRDKYLMCASPERFIKRQGNVLISQPIKGTAKRNNTSRKADDLERSDLLQNQKERSENIMIVDLVRNDLTKVCTEGSVQVDDFLKIFSFPQVHQMISTISGILKENIKLSEIFSATFPMGSMTGAPKKRVMQLIEEFEKTKRGLFSGTVGYINPYGDFDFNVVIRSIQYNSTNKYLSIMSGSAITFNSIPEKEYEECLVKISPMMKALK